MASSVRSKVDDIIQKNSVVIFSKSYCPYCAKAKKTLSGDDAVVLELDEMDEEGAEIQSYLAEKTSQRTVPSVWLGHQFIGGNSELQALSRKQIDAKIAA